MASNYYTDSTSTGGTFYISYAGANCTTGSTCGWVYSYQPRSYLVKEPARWKQKGKDAFIMLVNDETRTGWKVTMVIKGNVEILDPNIEVISAKKFAQIMRWNATLDDKAKIDAFAETWL